MFKYLFKFAETRFDLQLCPSCRHNS